MNEYLPAGATVVVVSELARARRDSCSAVSFLPPPPHFLLPSFSPHLLFLSSSVVVDTVVDGDEVVETSPAASASNCS